VSGSGIEVKGLATPDTVLLSYAPQRLTIDTGAGIDTVSFASAPAGVSTAATSYSRVENLIGSLSADNLIGSAGNDIFSVMQDNTGTISYLSAAPPVNARVGMAFSSFESLSGGPGNDRFNFLNQATVATGVFGDAHTTKDTLFIDDSNLTGDNFYTITANSVSRNPVYPFSGIEALFLNTGSGKDQVDTTFYPFSQAINGGPGEDTLRIPAAVNTNTPINQVGSGTVTYADVEKIVGSKGLVDAGNILQNTANGAVTLAQNNAANANNDVIDNFTGPGGVNLGGGIGGGPATGIAGQVAQAVGSLPDANTSPLADFYVTQYNSGGAIGALSMSGGVISFQGQSEINQNIGVGSEMELNAAMGRGEVGTADGNDGTVGVSGEGNAAPETAGNAPPENARCTTNRAGNRTKPPENAGKHTKPHQTAPNCTKLRPPCHKLSVRLGALAGQASLKFSCVMLALVGQMLQRRSPSALASATTSSRVGMPKRSS
jgi:hypothetical protein